MKKWTTGLFDEWKKKKDEELSKEFLPEALELIEKSPSPLGHAVLWIVLVIIIATLLWSYFGKVDEVATARGRVISADYLQTVQPMREGRIEEFYVQEGSAVTAGQKLIKLDSTVNEISYQNMMENVASLQTQNSLMAAFLRGDDLKAFFNAGSAGDLQQAFEYVASLQENYLTQKQQSILNISQFEEEVRIQENMLAQGMERLNLADAQKALFLEQESRVSPEEQVLEQIQSAIGHAREEERDYKALYEGGAVPENEWKAKSNQLSSLKEEYAVQQKKVEQLELQQRNELQQLENQIEEITIQNDITRQQIELARNKLAQGEISLKELNTNMEQTVNNFLLEKGIEIKNINAEIEKMRQELELGILYSPVNGIVQSLEIKTVGGVVTPAQPLITIAPSNTPIMVEASLLNKDVGFIQCGQRAAIKLDTYPFQQYGMLEGVVVYVSPDSELNDKNQLMYTVKIALESTTLESKGQIGKVGVGMEGSVEIKTGRRRVIEFFFDPFIKNLSESLQIR